MGFFEPSVIGPGEGGMMCPLHHNSVVIAPMIIKFGTGMKHNGNKKIVISLLLRSYDVILVF